MCLQVISKLQCEDLGRRLLLKSCSDLWSGLQSLDKKEFEILKFKSINISLKSIFRSHYQQGNLWRGENKVRMSLGLP